MMKMDVRNIILAILAISLVYVYFKGIRQLEQVTSFLSSKKNIEVSNLKSELNCLKKGIHTSGGFCLNPDNPIVGGNHMWDGKLCSGLEDIFGHSSVGDFGAGLGHYGTCFLRAGRTFLTTANKKVQNDTLMTYKEEMEMANLKDKPQVIRSWEGFDGALNIEEVSGGQIKYADLAAPLTLSKKYDWVLSLEVGEHIPREKEDIFIENLVKHACKGIVVSWAIVGQGGHHHVNTRNNDYIEKKMEEKGLQKDQEAAKKLRELSHLVYFKKTIMVFRFPKERC